MITFTANVDAEIMMLVGNVFRNVGLNTGTKKSVNVYAYPHNGKNAQQAPSTIQ
jgi:hypothetical protein